MGYRCEYIDFISQDITRMSQDAFVLCLGFDR